MFILVNVWYKILNLTLSQLLFYDIYWNHNTYEIYNIQRKSQGGPFYVCFTVGTSHTKSKCMFVF